MNKATIFLIDFMVYVTKKLFGVRSLHAMKFSNTDKFEDKLFCCDICRVRHIEFKILVDPYFPLMVGVDSDHFICGYEKTKDVDEDFIPNKYLLQEMDSLGK